MEKDEEDTKEEDKEKQEDNEKSNVYKFPITTTTILFQLLMVVAAIYYAMLLTNWGNPTVFNSTIYFYEANQISFWIKLVAYWVTIAIYLFSAIAPLLFPDREF